MSKYKTILQSNKDELHSLYEIAKPRFMETNLSYPPTI